ncbi:YlbF family regulator [Enterococcus sp. 2201sp1_2201st1_B8_2201SCRN_220225]|uniref:YlbF family regulator n=1 Tax=unclassified Enterococcus TaxID=2608891 RepID=UPI0034A57F31
MIYNEQMLQIDDQIDLVLKAIDQSDLLQNYQKSKRQMEADPKATLAKATFTKAKTRFEEISAYGQYVPGYHEGQKEVMVAKRKLDLTDSVSAFRFAETSLQSLLDEIGAQIAKAIDEEIKVDAGNPFFETGQSTSCGGNCHGS